jgi:dynein heavy chain
MVVQTSLGSKHVNEIREQVELWEKKLSYVQDCLDEWLIFQKTWMYLENIFNAEDIQKQLPGEAKQFQHVDRFWKEHMSRAKKDPKVLAACGNEITAQVYNNFFKYNKQLDEIQKSLEDYLETKRAAFPRFYFLSNDELLEILSQTKRPGRPAPPQEVLRQCCEGGVRQGR